jgi:hypothetical protein
LRLPLASSHYGIGASLAVTISDDAREAILEAQVNASLAGHDLGPSEPVDNEAGWMNAMWRNGNARLLFKRQDPQFLRTQ